MNRLNRLLGTVGAAALTFTSVSPAFAGGTQSGTSVTNTVTVNYQVGGVAQTSTGASSTFTVDRKVNVTVAEVGSSATSVSPGASSQVTTFTVTNNSNAVLDFALVAAQQSGGAGTFSGTDSFDGTNTKVYVDTNANGSYDAGTDLEASYLDELAADASKTVFVVADIPLSLANGSISAVSLKATGREGGASSSMGDALVQTNTSTANEADPNFVDTVFADVAGAVDGARDAAHSAKDDFIVSAATLTISKLSTVISDPLNGTTNPKAIPGATIQYCIVVSNDVGSAGATNVAISDPLPASVTYDGSGVFMNGTYSSGTCNADGSNAGSHASGTVSGTLSSVAAGETKTMLFRATIN